MSRGFPFHHLRSSKIRETDASLVQATRSHGVDFEQMGFKDPSRFRDGQLEGGWLEQVPTIDTETTWNRRCHPVSTGQCGECDLTPSSPVSLMEIRQNPIILGESPRNLDIEHFCERSSRVERVA